MKKALSTTDVCPEGYCGLTYGIYRGKEYKIIMCDFEEDLLAIDEEICGKPEGLLNWKRAESFAKVFNKPKPKPKT